MPPGGSRGSFGGGRSSGVGGRSFGGGSSRSGGGLLGGSRPSGGGSFSGSKSGGSFGGSKSSASSFGGSKSSRSFGGSQKSSTGRPSSPSRPSHNIKTHHSSVHKSGLSHRPQRPIVRNRHHRPMHRRHHFFFHYRHHRYYHVHGYRGAYYGANFGGALVSIGIVLLLIGVVLYIQNNEPLMNGVFIAGLATIGFGIILSAILNIRLARMRSHNEPQPDTSESDAIPEYVNTSPAPPAKRGGQCQSCGATNNSGSYCESCGAKL